LNVGIKTKYLVKFVALDPVILVYSAICRPCDVPCTDAPLILELESSHDAAIKYIYVVIDFPNPMVFRHSFPLRLDGH